MNMKILWVRSLNGGDYAAQAFEEKHGFESVLEAEIAAGETHFEDIEGGWEADVLEFGDVDDGFIAFIRESVQDEDDSKHSQFYVL